ncbi:MAG TPA: hypothetical protein VLA34_02260, partial [Candidatus Krumholzibacterium sp.]|nr:hypothetical protein [Candidatus Krumholzibacterium sp.]
LVTCIDVLEHIPPSLADKAVGELYRVAGSHVLMNICLWTERNARMDPTHINLRSRGYWERKFRRSGYALSDIPEDLPFAYNAFIIEKHRG